MIETSSTRMLNAEPIALMGLTQSELIFVLTLTFGSMFPLGVLTAFIFSSYWMVVLALVSGLGSLVVGWLLTRFVQATKKDTPPRYLLQRLQLVVNSMKWRPRLGPYYYRRTKR